MSDCHVKRTFKFFPRFIDAMDRRGAFGAQGHGIEGVGYWMQRSTEGAIT